MPTSIAEFADPILHARLVDNLYVEAMVMADDARAYFDGPGLEDREQLDAVMRLSFACESLKVTTRLMHIIAWLLTQKAWRRGEVDSEVLESEKYLLGEAAPTDEEALMAMPQRARCLVEGSQSLFERVLRLQEKMRATMRSGQQISDAQLPGSARDLLNRLEQSF